MSASRRKWAGLAIGGALIGSCCLFLFRASSRPEAPESRAPMPAAPAAAETPDHELKSLAIHLQKKPGHVPVLLRMAQLERDRGELEDAATHLREALKSEPANVDARVELGRVLYEKGDPGGAIAETEKVLASNAGQVDALYNLGAIYANLGNFDRARTYWTKAVAADPASESARKARESLGKLGS